MDPLKLIALDRDDLEIVSTHLQDSTIKVADIVWRPEEKRCVFGLNRFDWEQAVQGAAPEYKRRRTALRFDRVTACKCRNLSPVAKDAVLNLLAVEFSETDAPGGVVMLHFSGGGTLRLDVECLECELVDLGPVWPTSCCPQHAEDRAKA